MALEITDSNAPLTNSMEDQQFQLPNDVPSPSTSSTGGFVFEADDDILQAPDLGDKVLGFDPEYQRMLDNASVNVNSIASMPGLNFSGPRQRTLNSSADNFKNALKNAGSKSQELYSNLRQTPIANPIYSGIRSSGFDRFYEHPNFSKLGWSPLSTDTEAYYNANSTAAEDRSRMWGQFAGLAGTGFVSGYRSIADFFDNEKNPFTNPDLKSATEMEDAMAIGSSTRDGFAGSANNFLLNSAYTVGIIGNIAAEELVLWGAAALQGGLNPVADAAAAGRTGFNIARGGRAIANMFSVGKIATRTREMIQGFNQIGNAKDFYDAAKTGGKVVGNFFFSETGRALKGIKTAENTGQALNGIAKASKTFGGFYRDVRELNLALSESKMEAGMVYNDQLANSIAVIKERNGGKDLTSEEMKEANEYAEKASFATVSMNAPLIYLSNKIVLETAFKGFGGSIGRAFEQNLDKLGSRVIRTKALRDSTGKISRDVFGDAGDGMLGGLLPSMQRLKAYTVAGSAKAGAHGALRYFAANLSEGIQELSQEAISFGTQEYYTNLQKDPVNGGRDLLNATISSAINSQMNAQGFETFMSGFMMGGLIQGPQKLFFQGVPAVYNRLSDPKAYKEYQDNKKNYIDGLVKTYNEAWNMQASDPNAVFDPNKLNFLIQKEVSKEMQRSAFNDDVFGFTDAKDFGKFQMMYTIFENGTQNLFKDQLNDISKLSDEQLIEAYPTEAKDIKNGKFRTRLSEMVSKIDQTSNDFQDNKDQNINPFKPSSFKKGTREYINEAIKYRAFEHARYLTMFTKDGFERALERSNTIYNELASDPIIDKLAANDLTVLLDVDSINNEMELLSQELAILPTETAKEKKLVKDKTERFNKLKAYEAILNDEENLAKDGSFDKRKINKLRVAFKEYVQHLANSKGTFVDQKRIDTVLKNIVDHSVLRSRAKVYSKAIEYLSNPERLDEIFNRNVGLFKTLFENNKKDFESRIKKYINNIEINEFLNQLKNIDIYPNADQVEAFLATGDVSVLNEFIGEYGAITPVSDPEKWMELQRIINTYQKATTVQETSSEEDAAVVTDITDELDSLLGGVDLENGSPVNVVSNDVNDSPYAKSLLKNKYNKYRAEQTALNKKALTWDLWRVSKDAQVFIATLKTLKQMWGQTLDLTDPTVSENFKTDKGFQTWLQAQQTNDQVKKVLDVGNFKFEELVLKKDAVNEGSDSVVEGNKNKKWYKKGPGVNIIEINTINDEGQKATYWQIVDNDGKILNPELLKAAGINSAAVFTKPAAAVEAYGKLLDTIPDSSEFEFDGVKMSFGTLVKNKEGKEFIVLGTPAKVAKGNKLFLLPIEKNDIVGTREREKAAIKVEQGLFKGEYEVESLEFNSVALTANTSKLSLSEFTRSYAFRNAGESMEQSQLRLDIILGNLTLEEMNSLEFVIKLNEQAGTEKGDWSEQGKEANPYIRSKVEKYSIGIRISDVAIQARINELLKSKGVEQSESADSIFMFVRNNSVTLLNEDFKDIDINNITANQASLIFRSPKNAPITIGEIKKAYATQQLLTSKIEKLLGDQTQTVAKLEDLDNIFLNLYSRYNMNTVEKSLRDLDYFTVNDAGNIFILDTTKRKVKDGSFALSTNYITNLGQEFEQAEALIAEVTQTLKTQGLYDTAVKMGRYVAVIRDAQGVITLAQLKQNTMSAEDVDGLMKDLVDRAVQTTNENLDQKLDFKSAVAKSESFNIDWNNDFNDKFYIASQPGISIVMDITAWGAIKVEVYNARDNKVIDTLTIKQSELNTLEKDPSKIFDYIKEGLNKSEVIAKAKVNITTSNFKVVFDSNVSADTVVDNTKTTLDNRVRFGYNFNIVADSAELQAIQNIVQNVDPVTVTPYGSIAGIPIAVGDSTLETSEDTYEGILQMSEAEFEQHLSEDFSNISLDIKKQIANKVAKDGLDSLTDRESQLANNAEVASQMSILISKAQEQIASDPTANLKAEYELLESKIKARNSVILNELKEEDPTTANKKYVSARKTDPEILKLKAELEAIERKLLANKILSDDFTLSDVEDIDNFIAWAKDNLPDFIQISDIQTLENRLKVNGVRVGAFVLSLSNIAGKVEVDGTIYTGAASPYKYHEAFHAVFRMLLTEEEQATYLKLAEKEVKAKYGKDFETTLEKFKNSAEQYGMMSRSALEKEFYEEYMADQFEAFKSDRANTKTSSFIKSLFNRIIEMIKAVFKRYTKSELTRLYENINAGKFKNTSIQSNVFTQYGATGISFEANKILPYEKVFGDNGTFGYKYIDPNVSMKLVSSIAAMYLNRNISPGQSRQDILDGVIADFTELYNPEAVHNGSVENIDELINVHTAIVEFSDNLEESVKEMISIYDVQINDQEYINEELEESEGLRGVSDWNKDQSMIGGFSSLSRKLRMYIGTTTVDEADMFGNTELTPGEKLIVPVDFNSAYNGILKTVKNTTNSLEILTKLYFFGESGNTQSKAVINRMFMDIGVTPEDILNEQLPVELKNPFLFQEILNGFENFRVDYLFMHKNPNTKQTLIYSASQRDDMNNQISVWSQNYDAKFNILLKNESKLNEAKALLIKFQNRLNPELQRKTITDSALQKESFDLSVQMNDLLGISLSPMFIQYSLAKNITNPTKLQKVLINSNLNTSAFELEDASEIYTQVDLKNNLFADTNGVGVKSRLQKLAKGNVSFDESIGGSVFKNPNGDFVFAHQLPTYHLKKVQSLNNLEELNRLKTESQYALTNLLLNSLQFQQLAKEDRLKVLRISGSKQSNIETTDEGILQETGGVNLSDGGTTYGDFTPKQFLVNLINSYTYLYNTSSNENDTVIYTDPITGEQKETALAPVLIRVIEASNTGDLISLPVIKTITTDNTGNTVITEETKNLFIEEIKREYDRIKLESNEETRTQDLIEGYNAKNGARISTGRAFTFTKTAVLLTESTNKSEDRRKVKDPQVRKEEIKRLEDGTQTVLLRDANVAKKINFTKPGSSAVVEINKQKYVMYNRGLVSITADNIDEIMTNMGSAISYEKTDLFKYKVPVGSKTFWVETRDLQYFLQSKKDLYIYDLTKGDTITTVNETTEDLNLNIQTQLEKLAQNSQIEDLTFEQAVKSIGLTMNDLKEVVTNRLNSEYNDFYKTLEELRVISEISENLSEGFLNKAGMASPATVKAMDQLNLKRKNIDYNLKQIFLNDWLNTKAINQILIGDSALSLKDAVDEIKRAKMQNASYYSAKSDIIAKEYGINHTVDKISLFPFTDPTYDKKYSLEGGKGDKADAQMYITPKALRYMLFGFGKLDANKAILLDKIQRGEEVSSDEFYGTEDTEGFKSLDAIFNSEKLVYGDGKTFLKMSAVMLTKELTSDNIGTAEEPIWVAKPTRKELHNLRVKMEAFEEGKETIAISAPVSAIKMMKKNIMPNESLFYSDNALTADNETELKAEFMGLQMINPSNKIEITDPTQMKNLVTSEQIDSTPVIINGKQTDLGKVRKAYNDATARRVELKYINRRNLTFNFDMDIAMDELHKSISLDSVTPNLKSFLDYATEGLKASQSSANLLDFFSLDLSGQQKYNLNNPVTVQKFEQLFLAYFSKNILSEKIPGHTVALMSDVGMRVYRRVYSVDEVTGLPDRSEIIRESVWKKTGKDSEIVIDISNNPDLVGLADKVKKAGKKGVVIIDRLRSNVKEYNDKGKFTGQRYAEMLMPAHFKEVMDKIQNSNQPIPDVIAKMFAVRIPSQDKHSSMSVKLVDFLPVFMGSTGVFPEELVEVSGADFDIDKVYMHIKEWYESNGKFNEYGKGESIEDQYKDYGKYVSSKVSKKGTIYGEALSKAKSEASLLSKSISNEEKAELKANNFSNDAINALSILGLPITLDAYKKYKKKNGEPYEAPYNNETLDYKVALVSNDHMTNTANRDNPIAYEPADIKALTDVWDYITTELPELADLVKEEGVDVDNMYGKVRSFANNKQGAASIGAAVLPNLYLNLLKEFNISIKSKTVKGLETNPQIVLNGYTFADFGKGPKNATGNYQIVNGEEDVQGLRRQYVISGLITAMTDNAKERLAAKLGLNKDALGVAVVLTSLGVPLKTSILLLNQKLIRDDYFTAANKEDKFDAGVYKLVSDRLKNIKASFPEAAGISVTDELLEDSIKNIRAEFTVKNTMPDEETGEVLYTELDAAKDISILEQFLVAHRLKSYLANMASIINLSKGLGKNFTDLYGRNKQIQDLGIDLDDATFASLEYKGYPAPVDVRNIFKGDTWQAKYYEIYKEISDNILPSAFLTKTKMFESMYNTVLLNMTESMSYMSDEKKSKISKDLLSYITMKSYMQKLKNNNRDLSLSSLSNEFVYGESGSNFNVSKIVDELRSMPNNENNYFLNQFLFNDKATNDANNTGMNVISANTFTKLSEVQKMKIQNGFVELYGTPNTREYALHLLHYAMVKDGLQLGYKSILESFTPFTMDTYLTSIDGVHNAMKKGVSNNEFLNVFGVSYDKLISEFTTGYLQSNTNNYLLKTFSNIPTYNPKESSVTISKVGYKKAAIQNDTENVYIYGENQSELGKVGQTEIRGLDNAFPLTFKLSLDTTKDSYYTDNDYETYVALIDEQIDAINFSNKAKVFPASLMSQTDKTNMKKNSPKVYKYLSSRLKDEFGYDIEKGEALEKGSYSRKTIANRAVKIELEGSGKGKLIVDLYNQIQSVPESNDALVKRQGAKVSANLKQQFEKNKGNVENAGFELVTIQTKDGDSREAKFPAVIRVRQASEYQDTEYLFFKLVKIYSANQLQGEGFVNSKTPIAYGNRAEYELIETKGSNQQNAIGFMFDTEQYVRPYYKDVRKYVQSKNENNEYSYLDDVLDTVGDNVEFDAPPANNKNNIIESVLGNEDVNVIVDENSIVANGKNIAQLLGTDVTEQTTTEGEFDTEALSDLSDQGVVMTGAMFDFLGLNTNEVEDFNSDITLFWDENIQLNPEAKTKLEAQNILSLEDFIAARETGVYESNEEFLEHIKSCIL